MGSRLLDFTRSDYVATRVLLLGGVLSVPVTWAAAAAPWITGDALRQTVQLEESAAVTHPTPVAGVAAEWTGAVELSVADPSTAQWLAHLAPELLLGVAMLLVLVPVLRLIGAVQRGEAFSGGSVAGLRVVALTVVLAPWALLLLRAVTEAHLISQAFDEGFSVWIPVSGTTIAISAIGFVIAVVAEAFRRGLRLEHDVEGLV